MKKLSFKNFPRQSQFKAYCEHQAMMEMVIKEGYAKGKWLPMWARIIKQSGINDLDLQRLIKTAKSLPNRYSPAGFVRNRLTHKDWTKYFE